MLFEKGETMEILAVVGMCMAAVGVVYYDDEEHSENSIQLV